MAEALERVRDPLAVWLDPGPPAPALRVAARLAASLLPEAAADEPPSWLRTDQRLSFARALAAVRRYGGAVVADRPGTGKTWIGLAVATTLEPSREICVLAPATLRTQWEATARRSAVSIRFHSHELLSQGRTPDTQTRTLVIDESHRLRNPLTRRYLTLAPWCAGRRAVLLSATPAVNRFADLVHQLRLVVRDDALVWAGIPSLARFEPAAWRDELGRLVITGEDRTGQLPAAHCRDIRIDDPAEGALSLLLRGIGTLRLSTDPGIAGLIRVSLLAALASSPEAIGDGLTRYRALLLHARDAAAAGKRLTRQTIRQFVGGELEQLVFWPLVAEPMPAPELALEDLAALSRLETIAREWSAIPDAKSRALAGIAGDGRATLVFTGARATVRYLRRQLGSGIAWCTGERAGIDRMALPRDEVLDLFRRPVLPGEPHRPRLLIATDVAAEGLDLRLAARVVHYDLPWTAVRLEQRTGRAFRLGSSAARVEVVRFLPARALEHALRREHILSSKQGLPRRLGLEDEPDAPWKLRARLAAEWAGIPAAAGVASAPGDPPAVVAGIRFVFSTGRTDDVVLARTGTRWTGDADTIAALLAGAHREEPRAPNPVLLRMVLRQIAVVVRNRLRTARGARLGLASSASRRARRRLMELAREAGRRRDRASLAAIERGLRFLRQGHTAGESLLIQSWSRLGRRALFQALHHLPAAPPDPEMVRIEVNGLLFLGPESRPR